MYRPIPQTPSNKRVFGACLLSFMTLIAPIAAVGAATLRATAPAASKATTRPLAANEKSETALFAPAPVAAPIPEPAPAPVPLVPPGITASKVDSFASGDDVDNDGKADPGDKITYTTTITNSGGTDATHLKFTDTIDPHTTLVGGSVNTSPIANLDTYAASGNIPISLAAPGVLTNDIDPDNGSNTGLTVTEVQGSAGNVGNATNTTAAGRGGITGSVTLNSNGSFTYEPPPGFEGADTFTYKTSDGTSSDTTTVTINITGMVWFIQNGVGGSNLGTFSNPFTTIASFDTANAATGAIPDPKNGDFISLRLGSGTYSEVDGINLRNTQKLIGNAVMFSLAFTASTNSSSAYTTFAGATTAAPVITTSGGNGVDLADSNTVRGLNVGNTGSFYDFNGSAVGSPTINAVNVLGDGGAIRVSTSGTFGANVTFGTFESTTAPGGSNIVLTGVTGTLGIGSAGGGLAGSAVTTDAIVVNGGSVSFTYPGDVTKNNTGALLNVSNTHTGTLTFNTGTVSATAGTGLQFTDADGSYNFNGTTTLNGGDAGIDILNGSGGTFAFGGTTITNPSGVALNVDGSTTAVTGGITISGAIQKTNNPNAGRLIDFNNYDTGTATISGALTCNNGCDGIEVTNNGVNSGIVNFTNASKVLNTGADTAINLDNNDGGIINFTGNGLDIDTTTGAGFNATNGGTVTVQGTGNTITSTTGTALNVANTFIGLSGLNFLSIDSNGGTNGIVLNATGTTAGTNGGLTVTGTSTTDGTGGTIQNKDQGALFTSTINLTLKNMNFTSANSGNGTCNNLDTAAFNNACKAAINMDTVTTASFDNLVMDGGVQVGINGRTVSGLTISNSTVQNFGDNVNENDLRFFNLTGTCSITNSIFKKPGEFIVDLRNNTGTLNLSVTGSTFDDTASATFGAAGFNVVSTSTATMTVTIDNDILTKIKNAAVQAIAKMTSTMNLDITDCTMDPTGGAGGGIGRGPDISAQDTAHMNFNVNHNVKIYSKDGTAVNIYSFGSSIIQGRVNNNPDIRAGGVGSPGAAIAFQPQDNSTGTVEIIGNTISNVGGPNEAAIRVLSFGDGISQFSATADATIRNNTISLINNGVTGGGYQGSLFGIQAQGGSNASDTIKTCAAVGGTAGQGNAVSATPLAINNSDMISFRARVGSAGSFLYLQGFNTNASTTWNNNNNTPINSTSTSIAAGGTISAPPAGAPYNGLCRTPSNATAMLSPVNDPGAVPTYAQTASPSGDNTMALWTGLALSSEDSVPAILQSVSLNEITSQARRRVQSLFSDPVDASSVSDSTIRKVANASALLTGAKTALAQLAAVTASVTAIANTPRHGEQDTRRANSIQRTALAQAGSQVVDSTSRFNKRRSNEVKSNHVVRMRTRPTVAAAFMAVETVTIDGGAGVSPANSGFTLPAGKSITVTFKVTLDNPPNLTGVPPGTPQVSNQGTVTADGGISVVTDDPAVVGASDPTTTPVDLFDSQTTVVSDVPTATTTQTVTLTATVKIHPAQSPTPPSPLAPTGTVTFKDNGVTIGTCATQPLSASVTPGEATAQCATTLSPSGSHPITAVYNGDGNYDPSTSGAATVTIVDPPTIQKGFGAASIPLNGTTTVTFTLTNPNSSTLNGVAFNDNLPAGLVVADTPGVVNNCTTGTVTADPAATSISYASGSLTASQTCTIVVSVKGTTAGTKSNTTGAITSTEGGTGVASNTANLDVVAPPVIAKAFNPTNTTQGGNSTLTFTITNPTANTVALTGVAFTDNLPGGITVAAIPNVTPAVSPCGGTVTAVGGTGTITLSGGTIPTNSFCTISVDVTAMTGGTNQVTVTSTNGGTGNTAMATLTTCTPPPSGMTNWWTGDDTPRDITGGKDGTLNGLMGYAPGKVLDGFSFDGVDDYVDIGDVDLPNTFTIDAWVNPTNLSTERAIVSKDDGGAQRSYLLHITTAGELRALVQSGGGTFTQYQTAGGAVTTGTFQHVTVTYDGAAAANQKFKFYVNGTLAAASVVSGQDNGGTPEGNALAARIGRSADGSSPFLGVIDEVEFFSTVLSQPTIQAIVDAGPAGKCKPSDLKISKSHSGSFAQNSTGNTYTITVHNDGPGTTSGTTTVTDNLPAGLTATAMSGTGWTCAPVPPGPFPVTGPATLQCTSTDAIASGADFPAITLTVSVGVNVPSADNVVTVSGGGEMDTSDDTATDPTTLTPVADLQITKTDGSATEIPGTGVTYTITVTNAGPSDVSGATVADVFPVTITGVTYSSVATGLATGNTASGAGNINDTVNMPSGSTITYTVNGTISPSATGSLSNTATVTAPGGVTDAGGNNSATDTDTLTPVADLQITKTDGFPTEVPGTGVTYTITVTNAGPSDVTGATVADTFPGTITGVTYSSVATGLATGNTASGAGNINDTVNMPSGSTITYTATGTISSSATGSLSNTATVTAPGGVTDAGGNNSATDTDTLTPVADLQITKTDGFPTEVPGTGVTYTITVTNAGPSDVSGATVADVFPVTITGVTYSSVATGLATGNTASGAGNINDTVNMPSGSTITYTATGTISSSATGSLSNTATVTAPGGTTDPDTSNNSATDTDTLTVTADLSITKTDGTSNEVPGTSVSYTIVVTNNGPSNVIGATVADTFPATITGITYTSVAAGGATGNTAGAGNINDLVIMPSGSTITYTVNGTISPSATGSLSNTATVTAPGGTTDPDTSNNSATDTDALTGSADLQIISKTGIPTPTVIAGENITYTINFKNNGPSDAQTVTVTDPVPANTTFISAAITTGTGWTIPSPPAVGGTGNVVFSKGTVAAGETATFTVVVRVNSNTPGATIISNTATAASATSDPTPGNNTGNATTTVATSADLLVTKIDSPDPVVVGGNLTYTITVTNNGSSDAQNLALSDLLPPSTTLVSFTVPAGWTRTDVVAVGGTGTVTATSPTLAAGASAVFTLVVNVNLSTPHNTVLTNSATATTTTTDPNLLNNTGTTTTTVVGTLALTVNNNGDAPDANVGDRICDTDLATPGDQCTLRAAIRETNAAVTADTIDFNLPANTTITLLSALDDINGDLVITGPASGVTVSGNNSNRVFNVLSGKTVSILNLTLANGRANQGGGIFNSGNLTISNSTLTGNNAVGGTAEGGAIYSNGGTLTLLNSTISGNSANGSGGGIFNTGTSTATLVNDTVTNNRTDADGVNPGPGGGIAQSSTNSVTLRNTIVAGNFTGVAPGTAPDEISGTVDASSNNNLIGAAGFGGLTNGVNNNQVGVADARLAPLANNGGPTQTHALLAGATALDAGDNTTATNAGLTTDQRGPGFARSADGPDADATATVDIGAFEAQVWVEDIGDRSMNEDSTDSFSFNVGGAAAITSVTATSSNTALVPNNAANLNVSGSGSTRTLTISPLANQNGTTIITVTVNSASGSMTDTFVLTVNPVNDPPSFTKGPDQTVAEDSGPQTVPNWATNISPGPANESGQTLTFVVQNNTNPGLFSAGPAISSNGTLTYTTAANANGTATITIALMDNGGGTDTSPSQTFVITVTNVNDPPDAVNDVLSSVAEDSGVRTIPIASLLSNDNAGPADESGQTLTFALVNGSGVGGTVTSDATNVYFTPTADFNGAASFQYTVNDNGTTNGAPDPKSDTATVSFTVTEVNDAPIAVNDTLANIAEDSGPRTVPAADLIGNDSPGAANENSIPVFVNVGNAVGGTVTLVNGVVTFTPAADYNGPASFEYTIEDNDTTNGVPDPKVSLPATASFTITEVNDAPTANNDTLSNIAEDSGQRTIPFADLTGNDSKGPANESGQTLIVKTVSNAVGGTVSIVGGNVVFTPTTDYNGPASFDYTVEDNGTTNGVADPKTSGTATVSFSITAVADAPSVTNATTTANTQTTSGLVISRNANDGAEVTHFKITGITGGALFKNDGVTVINNGDFITFAEGNAGLKFTPAGTSNGSFTVQASLSASDAGLQGGTATATIFVNPVGGVIKFSAANYSVAEGAGFTTITVERTGDTSQAVTVDYASSDHSNPADFIPCTAAGAGFASSRCDFTTAIGTLRFAAGETSKTFDVLISQDNYVEGTETLNLTLSNPTGGAVFGVPAVAILSITDDATEGATNPIDTSSEFVRSQYHDFLHREPDAPGLAFWTDNIEKCNDPARIPAGQTVAQCIDKQRESTAIAFFMSPEFQITGGFVYHLYKGSLTGTPNYDGGSPGRFPTSLEFMRDVSTVSEGIVVNNQISGAVIEANRNRLAAEFVQRPEFVAKYGGLDNTLYVQELFNTTGIAATAAEKQALVDGLTNSTETRASVLRKIVDGTVVISEANVQFTTTYGQAFYNQEYRRVFVYMEYIGYLRRNPDAAGFIFWLGKLNFYNGDPFQAEMVRSFILSPEYRSRFGQP